MKNLMLLMLGLCIAMIGRAQYTYTIKADSVKITNSCDSAELIIENHTQGVPGFLFNTGRGRTIFKRALQKISDSLYLIGADTLHLSGGSGSGGSGNGAYIFNQDTAEQNARARYIKNTVDTSLVNTQFVARPRGVVDDSSFFSVDSSGDSRGMFYMFGAKSRWVELGWTGGGSADVWCNHIHVDTAASYWGGDQEANLYTFWQNTYYPHGKPTYHFYPGQHGPGGAQSPMVVTSSTWGRSYAFTNAPILGYYLLGGNSQVDTLGNQYPASVVFVIDTAGNANFHTLTVSGRNNNQAMLFANNSLPNGTGSDSLLTDSAGYVRHIAVSRIGGGASGALAGGNNGLSDSANYVQLGGTVSHSVVWNTTGGSAFGINSPNDVQGVPVLVLNPYQAYIGMNDSSDIYSGYAVNYGPSNGVFHTWYSSNKSTSVNVMYCNSFAGTTVFGVNDLSGNQVFQTGANYTYINSVANTDTTKFLQAGSGGVLQNVKIHPSTIGAAPQLGMSIFTPSSGGSVTAADNGYNVINPTSSLSSLTFTFPGSPSAGDVVEIKFIQAVGAITWPSNVKGGKTSAAAGDLMELHYDGSTNWY